MNQLFHARQKGTTKLGNTFKVLQDGPNSLHLTIQKGDDLAYEHLSDIKSEEELLTKVHELELILYPPLLPENTDETHK